MMARQAAAPSSPAAWPQPTRSKRFGHGAAPDRWPVNRGATSTTGTASTAIPRTKRQPHHRQRDHPQARSALTAPHDAGPESRPAPAGSDADGPDGPARHQAQSHFANPPTSKLSSKVDASGICHSRPSQRNRRPPGNRPNPRRRSNGDNQPISISAKKVTSSQRIMTPV